MSAAILSIGTELTRGELVNTNATWLAERLTATGFDVQSIETVDDVRGHIVDALLRMATRHRLIMVTGGLGPTTDDITAIAAAEAGQAKLVRSEVALEAMRRRFASLGREMTPSNCRQADFPEGADILPNPIGTAAGFMLRLGAAQLYFMPGVPTEMKRMFEEQVSPRIAASAPSDSAQNHLRTFGLAESRVGELLDGVEATFPGVVLGYRVHFPEVEVKVFARSKSKSEAQTLVDAATQEVRVRLGDAVYGEGATDSFPAAVGRTLRKRGLTLAVAESCTGGLIGHMLTTIPGSSEFLLFDGVVYSNASKSRVLGVDEELIRAHGAVSPECATAMAEGAQRIIGSDLALSVTGIAGPTGGSGQKPVGTVFFGLSSRNGTTVVEKHFPGDRVRVQTLSAYHALKLVLDAARGATDSQVMLAAQSGGH